MGALAAVTFGRKVLALGDGLWLMFLLGGERGLVTIAEGVFLGYVITPEGIKPCPDKTEAVLQLPSPQTVKKVQSLNGKLASLNRFLSKSAEKSLPLLQTLKKCIKKSDFRWTAEAEQAFQQLKQHLSELPLLVAPNPQEELIMYLSATYGAVSVVLMTERGTTQTLIYFISRALQGPELNNSPMEKLVMSLVFAAKRLQRAAAKIEHYAGRVNVDSKLVAYQVLGTYVAKEDTMIKYLEIVRGLVSGFTTFSISQVPRSKNKQADALSKIMSTSFTHLSKQVLVEVLENKSIKEKEVAVVIEEDGPTWMTQIADYLKEGILPRDNKEERKLRLKAHYVMREIHEGSCSMQAGPRSVVAKAIWLRHPQQSLTLITAPWPFYKWGIDIACPFPEGPGKVKFLIVAMDYFTKSVEAKAVATITDGHGDTPFSLTYGTEAVIPAEIEMPTYRTATVDVMNNDKELRLNLDLLEERRERAAVCEARAKSKMMKYYNARVRDVAFKPGDFVYRSNDASHAVAGEKLGPK
nr:reverse transcriptase domain-containing protein [Tanacetum cinerariifolium]